MNFHDSTISRLQRRFKEFGWTSNQPYNCRLCVTTPAQDSTFSLFTSKIVWDQSLRLMLKQSVCITKEFPPKLSETVSGKNLPPACCLLWGLEQVNAHIQWRLAHCKPSKKLNQEADYMHFYLAAWTVWPDAFRLAFDAAHAPLPVSLLSGAIHNLTGASTVDAWHPPPHLCSSTTQMNTFTFFKSIGCVFQSLLPSTSIPTYFLHNPNTSDLGPHRALQRPDNDRRLQNTVFNFETKLKLPLCPCLQCILINVYKKHILPHLCNFTA